MRLSRRGIFAAAAAGLASAAARAQGAPGQPRATRLKSLTGATQPITAQEHGTRVSKLQGLMQQQKVAALLVESGSVLEYFTGVHWPRSERTTAALIPATGPVVIVTPFFEERSK
jgi:Xaa-Pro dipeptidase